ncbi:ATPase subunit of ABC transporter with duplicated ATPase domains [Streptosporangium becharense]|uniref:ATPase subunit of ABC transporter with duplicated ATPase domains n=1 Tax=Streptosporangium becharense TaxID=1816182 RepID=A0A7W9MJM1_9ACTN|nr:ABC-F family ATP-binding cassette domain-containing protein [Streptosporangium becharense]MBB2915107.1 ATPase subunit of ABC transporter with duplicated ATPase domains [Streptosporangium becharense]MBB5822821.1 ATPase subunit of ABC transporter with duplicated ATPase domains [Streptosporangium becharense]
MPSTAAPFSVVVDGLSFAWPDGTPVLDDVDAAFPAGRIGLIGVNGSGKSTLIKLIAGELTPLSGTVSVAGRVGYLPQDLPLDTGRTVAELLGIAGRRAALLAIERGEVAEENFAVLGDDWDIEERARAQLDRLGLDHVGLDRTVATLSGGETVMVGLAALFLDAPEVLLLDEPTNNLDLDARRRLYAAVESWPGVLVVVSHDRALLELMDGIADLNDGVVRMYGGNLSAYEEMLAAEQEAAERMVRVAESDVRRQKREWEEAQVKLARRARYADTMYERKSRPKIVMQTRKREAQESAGKHRNLHAGKLAEARERLTEAERAVRDESGIRIELPETEVPAGRVVLTATGLRTAGGKAPGDLVVRGPERIALLGPNGAGKTTFLRTVAGELEPAGGSVAVTVPGVRYLPQRLDLLDDALSVVDNVRRFAPSASVNAVRARLARFLFRGDRAERPAGTLSGGERFRAVLAALLSAEPPPQLLLLDEPTNNLDMASVRQLAQALAAYRGALIVAGHDLPFLRSIGITRWLFIDNQGMLVDGLDSPPLFDGQ